MLPGYFLYSALILFITWAAILTQVYTTWSQMHSLVAMANQVLHSCFCHILRLILSFLDSVGCIPSMLCVDKGTSIS